MPDLTALRPRLQRTRARAQEVLRCAQQARRQAAQAQEQAALSYQRAQIVRLRRYMPGATWLTCALTAAILRQRGLLEEKTLTRTRVRPSVARPGLGRAFPRPAAKRGRP
jgi:type II secretory pathway pseudopilin PulG